MTGLGKIPIQINNGSKPWSGVTVGHVADESVPVCAAAPAAGNEVPMRVLKARDTVPRATLEVLAIVICLGEIARIDRLALPTQSFIIDYRLSSL
jgi:hypothetical protein